MFDIAWYDMTQYHTILYTIQYNTIRYSTNSANVRYVIQDDAIQHYTIPYTIYDTVWYDKAQYDAMQLSKIHHAKYDAARYSAAEYDMIQHNLIQCYTWYDKTHHSGEICLGLRVLRAFLCLGMNRYVKQKQTGCRRTQEHLGVQKTRASISHIFNRSIKRVITWERWK